MIIARGECDKRFPVKSLSLQAYQDPRPLILGLRQGRLVIHVLCAARSTSDKAILRPPRRRSGLEPKVLESIASSACHVTRQIAQYHHLAGGGFVPDQI